MEKPNQPLIRRAQEIPVVPTRRSGIKQQPFLGPADSAHQNILLIQAEQDAEVEVHHVANSESFFLLEGRLRVFGPGFDQRLGPGDVCYFPEETAHGVTCIEGPCRFLVIFAPAG